MNNPNGHTDGTGKAPKRTIVGGRPRERAARYGGIPRGIEVLTKKASVDPAFRQALLDRRSEAAREIELELTAAEGAMLEAIPKAQLKRIIEQTKVPDPQRRAFLGQVAAVMLSAIVSGCKPPTPDSADEATPTPSEVEVERGIQPVPEDEATSTPGATATPWVIEKGIRPDQVTPFPREVEKGIRPDPPQ